MPSTKVCFPQYVARQFGIVQAIPAPANTAVSRPPTKSTAETDRISAMGNRLRRFFKLVSFRPNRTGVVGFRFMTSWDAFCEQTFIPMTSQALHKILHYEGMLLTN